MSAAKAIRALGAAAMQPLCGLTNENVLQTRSGLELQDTLVVSNTLRFASGIGARAQRAESQTFLNGRVSNGVSYAFATAEYKPAPSWVVNFGGFLERERLSGSTFAPRAAANLQLGPAQTLRFGVSKGVRTPDILEQRANISYKVQPYIPPGAPPLMFYQNAQSSGGLDAESVVSHEIGYVLNIPGRGLTMDTRVFRDRLRYLISQPVVVTSFRPTNQNAVNLSGAEIHLNYKVTPSTSGFFSYAYLRTHGSTDPIERGQYSRKSGAVGLSFDIGNGMQLSGSYVGASGNELGASSYGRFDAILSKSMPIQEGRLEAQLRIGRLNSAATTYYRGEGFSLGRSEVNDRLQLGCAVRIAFR